VTLFYAQVTGKDSLRELETGFNLQMGVWHHLGIGSVARSSLAEANSRRSSEIFEKLFYAMLSRCREITPHREFKFDNPLYSFDSSTISLCLSLFDWAKYRTAKGALKLHLLLNNRTAIPELITITEGSVGDNTEFKKIDLKMFEKGSIIVFDRGYIDLNRWHEIHESKLFFVSRTRDNQNIFRTGQHKMMPLEKNVLADEAVICGDLKAMGKYPDKLRRVRYDGRSNYFLNG
jgi:hypothetical protein